MKKTSIDLGHTDTDLNNSLENLTQVLKILPTDLNKQMQEVMKLGKEAIEKSKNVNPYQTALDLHKTQKESLNADFGSYDSGVDAKLGVNKRYNEELEKLNVNAMGFSGGMLSNAKNALNVQYAQAAVQAEEQVWADRGDKIGSILENGFSKALINFEDFGGSMKNMANQLCNYLIQQSVQAVMQSIFGIGKLNGLVNFQKNNSKSGGFFGGLGGIVSGIGKGLGWFHSGGIAPVGANAEIPGTKEQLAMLKGGERVLSPAENTSYNNNSGSSPVVFNNFNVKAWDSKDVSKYLLENKQLLNAITFEGIKYNNGHLRTMVRNA